MDTDKILTQVKALPHSIRSLYEILTTDELLKEDMKVVKQLRTEVKQTRQVALDRALARYIVKNGGKP